MDYLVKVTFWCAPIADHEPYTSVQIVYSSVEELDVDSYIPIPQISKDMRDAGFERADYVTVEVFKKLYG